MNILKEEHEFRQRRYGPNEVSNEKWIGIWIVISAIFVTVGIVTSIEVITMIGILCLVVGPVEVCCNLLRYKRQCK